MDTGVAQLEYRLLVPFEKKTRANLNVLVRFDHIELERKFIRKQMANDLLPDGEDLVVLGEDAVDHVADGLLHRELPQMNTLSCR